MKKALRIAGLVILAALVVIQFIRPERNLSNDQTYALEKTYPVPADVKLILKTACNDCHSNNTEYPWYANLQPVAWFLDDHVQEGKRHLNFSTFTSMKVAVQNHKMEEVIEQVKEGEMPLESYTIIHRDAILTQDQQVALTSWAESIMDNLHANYPADSLVLRRPGGAGGPPPPPSEENERD